MSDNPYAAPKAHVSDIETATAPFERPRQVVWAIWILIANWVFGFTVIVSNWSFYQHLGRVGSLIFGQVAGVAILVWLYTKIWQGRNWARIVLLVFSLLGVIGVVIMRVMKISENTPPLIRASSMVGWVVAAVVIWLLFFSPGKEWFRPRD